MEKWFVYAKKADFKAWGERLGVAPVVARIIRNRDVMSEEEAAKFLNGTLEDCHSPWLLKDMELAVDGVLSAVKSGKRIRVIGDYDVDGICSAYILTKGISLLGGCVDTAIPHRIHDGYGLNDNLIREAKQDGIEMIVTCDNGIAAASQVELAKSLDMEVIVTDHHEVPFEITDGVRKEILPKALAVVDPKRGEDSYPFPGICGGVLAYKLMQAVAERLSKDAVAAGQFRAESFLPAMEEFLEFAAFATVCDVMELKDENRILVKEGLCRLRNSKNQGLRALTEANGIDKRSLSAYHLGFVLGPCLNATGRLDTATRALELLNARDGVEAAMVARDLKELNDSRKNLTLQGIDLAIKTIREEGLSGDKVLVVYLPEVHESLAGIIAGRIREQYGRPAFLLTKGEEGVKGSGRSMEKYDMYAALTEVGNLLTKFGGHKMAAGLSLEEANIGEFRRRLNENCQLTEEDFVPVLHVDAEMPMEYADLALARQLEALEPFGVGNPKPLFVQRDVSFLSGSRMGKEGKYGRFQVRVPSGARFSVIFFGDVDAFRNFLDNKYGMGSADKLFAGQGAYSVTVAYQIGIHTYQGKEDLQILMKSYQ